MEAIHNGTCCDGAALSVEGENAELVDVLLHRIANDLERPEHGGPNDGETLHDVSWPCDGGLVVTRGGRTYHVKVSIR